MPKHGTHCERGTTQIPQDVFLRSWPCNAGYTDALLNSSGGLLGSECPVISAGGFQPVTRLLFRAACKRGLFSVIARFEA